MKRITASFLSILLIFTMILSVPSTVKADIKWPSGPSVSSKSAMVIEMDTGTVMYEKKSHDQKYPASITKILTVYLAILNCDLDEEVTFSTTAVYENEGDTSHISRDVGEIMTVEECLYAIMLASANECAYAIAEHVGAKLGGDYSTFIDLMNSTAEELGCTDTHFNNCNGLPDEDHYTSAHDMALFSTAAYSNETFRTITGTASYAIEPTNKHSDPTYLSNHHAILHYYRTSQYISEYCTGGKTGYTSYANSTLVTYAEKDGMKLCIVVMDANSPAHYTDTLKLMDYMFSNFKAYNIADNETSLQTENNKDLGILNNNPSFVTLDAEACIILPSTAEFSDAEFEKDDGDSSSSVAKLKYTYGDREVGTAEIVATGAEVEESYFGDQVVEDDENVIRIRPIYLAFAAAALVVLIILLILLIHLIRNFYFIRHTWAEKRYQRSRFKEKKKKRRRKKDAMFK